MLLRVRLSTQGYRAHTKQNRRLGTRAAAGRAKTCLPVMTAPPRVLPGVLTCVMASLLLAQPAQAFQIQDVVDAISDLGPVYGAALFVVAYVVFTVLLIPGSLLTLAAGALFGPVEGTAIVSLASTLGAVAAFMIARYGAQPWVEGRLKGNPKLKATISSISAEGTKLVFLLRLSPLFPFTLLNYVLGLTTISLRDYTFASWSGMLPATFAYVYLGGVGKAAADAATGEGFTPQQICVWLIGIGASLLATKIISNAASKALKDAEERQQLLEEERQ